MREMLVAYGESFPPCSNPTIIIGCKVARVVGHSCIVTACCGLEIGCGEETFVAEHSAGDIVRELLDLFLDVLQKCI